MKKRSESNSWNSKNILKVVLFVVIILVVISIFFVFRNSGKISEKSFTGKVIYNSPLTLEQLRSGVNLDITNILIWTNDIPQELPIEQAFSSILDSNNYVYDYSTGNYWFNPNGDFAYYNNYSYYQNKKFDKIRPGIKYYLNLKNKDVLIYNPEPLVSITLADGKKIIPKKEVELVPGVFIEEIICVNRSSLVLQSNCYDLDGMNPYVSSSTRATKSGEKFDFCDFDGKTLKEAVCGFVNNSYTTTSTYVKYDCSSENKVCMNGACVQQNISGNQTICSELSDNVKNKVKELQGNGHKVILKEGNVIHYSNYTLVNDKKSSITVVRLSYVRNSSTASFSDDRVRFMDVFNNYTYETAFTKEGEGIISINGRDIVVSLKGASYFMSEDYEVRLRWSPLGESDDFSSCFI